MVSPSLISKLIVCASEKKLNINVFYCDSTFGCRVIQDFGLCSKLKQEMLLSHGWRLEANISPARIVVSPSLISKLIVCASEKKLNINVEW